MNQPINVIAEINGYFDNAINQVRTNAQTTGFNPHLNTMRDVLDWQVRGGKTEFSQLDEKIRRETTALYLLSCMEMDKGEIMDEFIVENARLREIAYLSVMYCESDDPKYLLAVGKRLKETMADYLPTLMEEEMEKANRSYQETRRDCEAEARGSYADELFGA